MSDVRAELGPGISVLLAPQANRLSPTDPADPPAPPTPVVTGLPAPARPTPVDAGPDELPPWRRRERAAGHAVLRRLLADALPSAVDAPVGYADTGRPHLVGWPRVGISIAHDADAVAVAVAVGHHVGIDVQHPADVVPDSLLRRCLRQHSRELTRLPMAHRATELAWVWTAQEACVKAAGTGLAGRPWAIDVPPYARAGRWGRYRWVSLRESCPVPVSCAYAPLSGGR